MRNLKYMEWDSKKFLLLAVVTLLFIISVAALNNYPGQWLYYIIFSVLFNYAFVKAIFFPSFFFETFLYVFLWLGFWLKFSYRTILQNYSFVEATGSFDYSNDSLDRVLMIGSLAVATCIVTVTTASRVKLFKREKIQKHEFPALRFYEKNWIPIWGFFLAFVLAVGILNFNFGIYIRGMAPEVQIFSPLRNLIVWLLLGGLGCVAATFVYWEMLLKRHFFSALIFALFEILISSTAMLSRAFIINSASQIWALLGQNRLRIDLGWKKSTVLATSVGLMFVSSVIGVGYLRYEKYPRTHVRTVASADNFVKSNSTSLFIDRWVGLEGLMSVVSYPNLGWGLLAKAWNEPMDPQKHGFYDSEIAKSQYLGIKLTKQHFITLPGIVAFLFYPGSILFLMLMLSIICLVFVSIETLISNKIGNPFLTALFAQSAAYKLLHFGYAPHQFWKYFAAFLITLWFIYKIQEFRKLKATTLPLNLS